MSRGACFCAVLLLAAGVAGAQQRGPLRGDQNDGSRARPVHVISLRDSEGEIIRPEDRPLLPFSTRQTCGADCHDVATISRGWHFNATARGQVPGGQAPGRPGEPWILVDPETATQLPLSYHRWPGTFDPEDVGVTPWSFASMFGDRTPGGIAGTGERSPNLQARWVVSGELEVNCLACHDASPAYDQAEYGRQLRLQNFRWAPAAASGMALVTGSAKEMPNTFDYLLPSVEDALLPRMPAVIYEPGRFLPGAKVVFDIVRDVPARRCYLCHSNTDVAETGQGRWPRDEDIHLARGMTCVDCHRNGLDHAMTRGYEGAKPTPGSANAALTCRGCHLATEPERNFARGRFGAPYPRHAGLPPIHLTKLSCTACHSGPRPEKTTRAMKTSLAHRLGGFDVNKAGAVLPHLYSPVFVQQPNGETAPNRLVWPAFWGRMSNGAVRPIAPGLVRAAMSRAKVALKPPADGSWPALDEPTLARILGVLQSQPPTEGSPVYVAGGRLHRLDASGKIATEGHRSAQPCLWPLAHDVRPASLALGARGCDDCHDAGAPIFFGDVSVDSPLASERTQSWKMHAFQKTLDTRYVADFARSFQYRAWLDGGLIAAVGILLLFVLAYSMSGLQRLSAAAATGRWLRLVVNVAAIASCAITVASGYQALLSGQRLTGYPLITHVAVAPAFVVCAVLLALFWAQRNGFSRADWNRVRRPFGAALPRNATPYAAVLRKLFFWLATAAIIPAIASISLAMFPVLASVRQGTLLLIHRYSVVVLTAGAALFAFFAFAGWLWARVGRE